MALDTTVSGATADSYGTLADFKVYAGRIGFDIATKTDAELEISMIKATQYLERANSGFWAGFRATQPQSLAWPRTAISGGTTELCDCDGFPVPINEVPVNIKSAQFEAAILDIGGTILLPNTIPSTTNAGGAITKTRVKAGPVESETQYSSNSTSGSNSIYPTFTGIDGLLKCLVTGSRGSGTKTIPIIRG